MQKIAINYGLKMFAGFAGLFLLVHFLGMSENYNLRVLNGVIHIGLLYFAIREYRLTFPETHNNYMSGVGVGMFASMLGVVAFTVFMVIFLTFIDPGFFARLEAKSAFPDFVNQFTACLFIFVEGIAVSLIGSYLVTRVIDANWESAKR